MRQPWVNKGASSPRVAAAFPSDTGMTSTLTAGCCSGLECLRAGEGGLQVHIQSSWEERLACRLKLGWSKLKASRVKVQQVWNEKRKQKESKGRYTHINNHAQAIKLFRLMLPKWMLTKSERHYVTLQGGVILRGNQTKTHNSLVKDQINLRSVQGSVLRAPPPTPWLGKGGSYHPGWGKGWSPALSPLSPAPWPSLTRGETWPAIQGGQG